MIFQPPPLCSPVNHSPKPLPLLPIWKIIKIFTFKTNSKITSLFCLTKSLFWLRKSIKRHTYYALLIRIWPKTSVFEVKGNGVWGSRRNGVTSGWSVWEGIGCVEETAKCRRKENEKNRKRSRRHLWAAPNPQPPGTP